MIGESLAIILVILVMSFMYRRAGRGSIAVIALPLICVPCARLVSSVVLGTVPSADNLIYSYIIIIAGLVTGVALCTWVSRGIKSRTVRVGYLLLSLIFSGALVVAYLI